MYPFSPLSYFYGTPNLPLTQVHTRTGQQPRDNTSTSIISIKNVVGLRPPLHLSPSLPPSSRPHTGLLHPHTPFNTCGTHPSSLRPSLRPLLALVRHGHFGRCVPDAIQQLHNLPIQAHGNPHFQAHSRQPRPHPLVKPSDALVLHNLPNAVQRARVLRRFQPLHPALYNVNPLEGQDRNPTSRSTSSSALNGSVELNVVLDDGEDAKAGGLSGGHLKRKGREAGRQKGTGGEEGS